jgi:hypothetical protein
MQITWSKNRRWNNPKLLQLLKIANWFVIHKLCKNWVPIFPQFLGHPWKKYYVPSMCKLEPMLCQWMENIIGLNSSPFSLLKGSWRLFRCFSCLIWKELLAKIGENKCPLINIIYLYITQSQNICTHYWYYRKDYSMYNITYPSTVLNNDTHWCALSYST